MSPLPPTNPFAAPSPLPLGVLDFAAIRPPDYREALEAGMVEQLAALASLAADPEPATEDNVLHAWERSGQVLSRANAVLHTVRAADTTDELDALAAEFAPRLAAHSDAIHMDPRLFDRLTELAGRADAGDVVLDAEARWLLSELRAGFVRAGVTLAPAEQERLRALNARLADLATAFEKANLAARNAGAVVVTDPAELDGLPDAECDRLAQDDGTWRIPLVNTTQQPLLARLHDRGLRRRLYEASVGRATTGEGDTRQLLVDIVRARAERARLLGYDNHVAYATERACAKEPEAVSAMLRALGPAALAQARRDAVELGARLAEIEPGAELAPWDWSYVAEIVRRERYDLDLAALEPHLGVETVLAAVYGAAERLYGITLVRRPELRGHTAEADVYEVRDADGSVLGAFVMDFWSRPTKQGGAWMTSLVRQAHLTGECPVVTNNCNYPPGTTAITWDGVITMFHEFGHALHALVADSRYPSRSGTATPRDFVEFPSQVNEHWAWEPDAVLPAEEAATMTRADAFNQGFGSVEAFAAMLLDHVWHTTPLEELPVSGDEVAAFEERALDAVGMNYDLIPPRYRSPYFSHIWGSGYSGAYYSYAWAEVMDADAVTWFTDNGGGTRANGDHFRRTLLAPGGSVDVMQTWRAFRGRDPEIGPLLERKGLQPSADPTGIRSTSSV